MLLESVHKIRKEADREQLQQVSAESCRALARRLTGNLASDKRRDPKERCLGTARTPGSRPGRAPPTRS